MPGKATWKTLNSCLSFFSALLVYYLVSNSVLIIMSAQNTWRRADKTSLSLLCEPLGRQTS